MYRFKLEALLNHRRYQEEALQKELAEAQIKLADEQKKLRNKKREKRENVQTLQKKQKESGTVTEFVLYVNYIEQLSKEIENQTRRVQHTVKNVNQIRNELIAVMKKRKALEKLKEKGWRAYQQKQRQDERKLMDDIASTRRARKT